MEGCKLYEAGVAVLSLLNRCQSIGDTELFPSQCSPLLIWVFVQLDDQKLSSPYRGYIHSIFSIYIIDWDLKALCPSLNKPHSWVLVPNSVPSEWEEARNWLNAAVLPHGFLKCQLVSLAHLSQIYDSISPLPSSVWRSKNEDSISRLLLKAGNLEFKGRGVCKHLNIVS